jgi:hypothetical protein
LTDPSSSRPYEIVPIEQYVNQPAVVELVKAFGRGELQHGAAQAAAWHLNSGVSWADLAAKRQGTARSLNRPPYFSSFELQAGLAYANEAQRRGQLAQLEAQRKGTGAASPSAPAGSSDALSTAPDDAIEPAKEADRDSAEKSRDGDAR